MSVLARRIWVPRLTLALGTLRRGLIAGSAWGVTMAALLIGRELWTCGGICLSDAALTTAFSTAGGILTIGPLAAFGRKA